MHCKQLKRKQIAYNNSRIDLNSYLILPFTCMREADYTLKTETGLFRCDRFPFSQASFSRSLLFNPYLGGQRCSRECEQGH